MKDLKNYVFLYVDITSKNIVTSEFCGIPPWIALTWLPDPGLNS